MKFSEWVYISLGMIYQSPALAVSPIEPTFAVKAYGQLCRVIEGDAVADNLLINAEKTWSEAFGGSPFVCVGRLHRLLKGAPADAAIRHIPFAKHCIENKKQSSAALGAQFLEWDFEKPLICDWSIGESSFEHPKMCMRVGDVESLLHKSGIHTAGKMVSLGPERWDFARLHADSAPGAFLYPHTLDEYLSKSVVLLSESQYQRLHKLSQGEKVAPISQIRRVAISNSQEDFAC